MSVLVPWNGGATVSAGHLTYPNSGGVAAISNIQQLTMSLWMKTTSGVTPNYSGVIQKGDSGGSFGIDAINSVTWWRFNARTGGDTPDWLTAGEIPGAGVWFHLYMVYDGTLTNKFRVWVNGSEKSFGTRNAASSIGTNSTGMTVGWNGNNAFGARYAELAFWVGEAITTGGVISDLAAGVAASTARPTGLDFYAPLLSDANDTIASVAGTLSGTAAIDGDHPTIAGGGGGGGAATRNRVMLVL